MSSSEEESATADYNRSSTDSFAVLLKLCLTRGVMKRPVNERRTGWTQAGLAEAIGMTDKAIRNWLSGKNTPSATNFDALLTELTRKEVSLYREFEDACAYWRGPPPSDRLGPKQRTVAEVLSDATKIGVGKPDDKRWSTEALAEAADIEANRFAEILEGAMPEEAEVDRLIAVFGGGLVAEDHEFLVRLEKAGQELTSPSHSSEDEDVDEDLGFQHEDERDAEPSDPDQKVKFHDHPVQNMTPIPWTAITGTAAVAAVALALVQMWSPRGNTAISVGGEPAIITGGSSKVIYERNINTQTGNNSPVNIGGIQNIESD